jgi:hypothetical protein
VPHSNPMDQVDGSLVHRLGPPAALQGPHALRSRTACAKLIRPTVQGMLVGQEIAAGAHPIDDATAMASSSSPMPRRKRQTQARSRYR